MYSRTVTAERVARASKRLGFELECVLRKAQLVSGKYLDANLYGMLAGDWKRASISSRAR